MTPPRSPSLTAASGLYALPRLDDTQPRDQRHSTPSPRPRARTTRARALSWWARVRGLVVRFSDDGGAATAEYAIATLAAVGLAGLLVVILKGDDVKGMLTELIHRALTSAG